MNNMNGAGQPAGQRGLLNRAVALASTNLVLFAILTVVNMVLITANADIRFSFSAEIALESFPQSSYRQRFRRYSSFTAFRHSKRPVRQRLPRYSLCLRLSAWDLYFFARYSARKSRDG